MSKTLARGNCLQNRSCTPHMFRKKRNEVLLSNLVSVLVGYLLSTTFNKHKHSTEVINNRNSLEMSSPELLEEQLVKEPSLKDSSCARRTQKERLKELKCLTPDLAVAPTISVTIAGSIVNYVYFNSWTLQRARTIKSKEPGTLKWISTFLPDDTVWDIGANVGMYTIYAAKQVKSVYAFEPNNGNTFTLLANIRANNLCNVRVFAIGLGDRNGFFPFEYSSLHFGVAHNQIQTSANHTISKKKKKYHETEMKTVQTLDFMVAHSYISLPQHIKLDVDGLELSILRGMRDSLQSGSVKTLLVEAEGYEQALEIHDFMMELGARLVRIDILSFTGRQVLYDDGTGIPKNAIANMIWSIK